MRGPGRGGSEKGKRYPRAESNSTSRLAAGEAGVKMGEVSYHSGRSRWSTDFVLFAIFHLGSLGIYKLKMDI